MNGLTHVRQGSIVAALAMVLVLASVGYGAPIPLTNGVPASGLSGAKDSETVYTLVVPAGQDKLKIVITGGTGDADLYVKKDAVPTTSSWDYRPFLNGNEETVDVNSPAAGTWYIMLRGFQAYAGVTLTATYSSATHLTTLTNNVPVTGLAGAKDSQTFFKIDVPVGQTKLEISTSGGTGDCDLYVKKDTMPTPEIYDYRPFQNGNNEKVTINDPAAGTYYVMLRGFNAYSGVTLLAAYTGNVGTLLVNGVPVTGIGGAAGSDKFYRIDVPAGQLTLEIQITGGTGDCDLYVKQGTVPTITNWDYRPFVSGNEETVDVNNPAAGTWYIMLHGYADYANLTLKATYGAVITLTDGVPVTGIAGALNSERYYQLDVPDGCTSLTFSISGGTGNCDLYVRAGAMPTTSVYDYRPYLTGNNETVAITSPHSGIWYVLLKGRQAYSGVTLLGDYSNIRTLVNGVPVSGLSGAEGSEVVYQINVPSGQTSFVVQISGGTGDCDLYVKRDAPPTTGNWDGRGFLNGNEETVPFTNPTAGTWYIMLRGYAAYANLTLLATYTGGGGGDVTLTNGVKVTGLSGATGSNNYFILNVPAGQAQLSFVMTGGPGSTGDADMFMRVGTKPTTTAWDYRTAVSGNDESISISNPTPGIWYILLNGRVAYSGVSLVGTYVASPEPVTLLTNGVPVADIAGVQNSEKFYKIVVPAGQDYLRFTTSGGTGDVDIAVKRGAKPTSSSFDYFSALSGNNETIDIPHPAADTWYIMLRGYTAYTGVSLVASYGVNVTGNIFNTDPNCVAVWNLEPGLLTIDSRGTNKLTNYNGVASDTTSFKQGTGCADFNDYNWLTINDANLTPNFPFKDGTSNDRISVTGWVKLDSLPTDHGPYGYKVIYAKDSATWPDFIEGFAITVGQFYYPSTNDYRSSFAIMVSHAGSYKQYWLPNEVVTGRWYHLAVTFTNAGKAYHIRVWDAQAGALLGDTTGVTDDYATFNKLPARLGAIASGTKAFNGRMDEMVVFNDILTNTEIDKIRQGTYGH